MEKVDYMEDGKEKYKLLADRAKAKQSLIKRIVEDMNRFLFILRRQSGRPNIWEEYKRQQTCEFSKQPYDIHVYCKRSDSDLKTAYNKYTFHWCDGKSSTSLANLWLKHRDSREYDYVSFEPEAPADSNPRVFNLFRGLRISRDMAVEGNIAPFLTISPLSGVVEILK